MNLKRFLLMFIICISSFIIYSNNVKADSYNFYGFTPTCNGFTCANNDIFYTFQVPNTSNSLGTTYNISTNLYNTSILKNNDYFLVTLNIQDLKTNTGTQTATCNSNDNFNGFITTNEGTWWTFESNNGNCNNWSISPSSVTQYGIAFNLRYLADGYANYSCVLNTSTDSYMTFACPSNKQQFEVTNLMLQVYNGLSGGAILHFNSMLVGVTDSLSSVANSSNAINNNTNEIKNDIKDSSIDNNNTSSSASSWANKNASNGTITNLLTLPISLLQNILNGIQTTCSSFSLGTLFDTELILPCINLSDLIGSTLFNVIDLLFSGFMILNIAKKLIKIFNDFTNLKSNQIDEIYSNGGGAS